MEGAQIDMSLRDEVTCSPRHPPIHHVAIALQ